MRMFGILSVERAGPNGRGVVRNTSFGSGDVTSRQELFAKLRDELPEDWHSPAAILVRFFYAEPDELPAGIPEAISVPSTQDTPEG